MPAINDTLRNVRVRAEPDTKTYSVVCFFTGCSLGILPAGSPFPGRKAEAIQTYEEAASIALKLDSWLTFQRALRCRKK